MRTAIRGVLFTALASTIFGLVGVGILKAEPKFDRECLRGFITKYLDALIAHKPGDVPVAKNMRFTENTVDTRLGEGLWKTVTKLIPYRQDIIDMRQGVVGTHSVVEEGRNTVLLLVRLKVVDRKITEIETQVTRITPGGPFSSPTMLKATSPAMNMIPPKDKLNSREDAIKIGLKYPEGLKVGSFVTADTPVSKDCYRIENGYITAGPDCKRGGCDDVKTQRIPRLSEITSRVAAVDEEMGIVWIRMDFGKGSMGVGADADKRSLIVWEAFKVYDGQIHAIEAFMLDMPRETPSGWDPK